MVDGAQQDIFQRHKARINRMEMLTDGLKREDIYKLITGCVVPRPIAWVSSLNENGTVNLAPFSTFTFVASYHPMLGFNVGRRKDRPKDTTRNIQEIGDYVVNIADELLLNDLHSSSFEYPPGVSEPEVLGLETVASTIVRSPRIVLSPISMECRLVSITDFSGNGDGFVVGQVLAFHVRDDLLDGMKIDSRKLRPVSRLAGENYGHLGEIISMVTSSNGPPPSR